MATGRSRISSTELSDYREIFNTFHIDGDGSITVKELATVLNQMGHEASEETLGQMLGEADTDGDGSIDFDEFTDMMMKKEDYKQEEDKIREAFHSFDLDGDGFITKEELKTALRNMGQQITEEEIAHMLEMADADGDGQITFEEFSEMMRNQ